jgi:hypothetical protein
MVSLLLAQSAQDSFHSVKRMADQDANMFTVLPAEGDDEDTEQKIINEGNAHYYTCFALADSKQNTRHGRRTVLSSMI